MSKLRRRILTPLDQEICKSSEVCSHCTLISIISRAQHSPRILNHYPGVGPRFISKFTPNFDTSPNIAPRLVCKCTPLCQRPKRGHSNNASFSPYGITEACGDCVRRLRRRESVFPNLRKSAQSADTSFPPVTRLFTKQARHRRSLQRRAVGIPGSVNLPALLIPRTTTTLSPTLASFQAVLVPHFCPPHPASTTPHRTNCHPRGVLWMPSIVLRRCLSPAPHRARRGIVRVQRRHGQGNRSQSLS